MVNLKGIVLSTNDSLYSTALVKTVNLNVCDSCSSKDFCNDRKFNELKIEVINEVFASKGDLILLSIRNRSILNVIFIIYILPILSIFFGFIIGNLFKFFFNFQKSINLDIFFVFFFLVISFFFIVLIGNKLSNKYRYKINIIKIISLSKN